jgi:hypothetical protein
MLPGKGTFFSRAHARITTLIAFLECHAWDPMAAITNSKEIRFVKSQSNQTEERKKRILHVAVLLGPGAGHSHCIEFCYLNPAAFYSFSVSLYWSIIFSYFLPNMLHILLVMARFSRTLDSILVIAMYFHAADKSRLFFSYYLLPPRPPRLYKQHRTACSGCKIPREITPFQHSSMDAIIASLHPIALPHRTC